MEVLVVFLVILFASVPMISATDGADEAAITRDDCDEFVHRIFNMVSDCVIKLSLLMRPDTWLLIWL